MNMWCTGLLCFLLNPFTDWLTNKSENIVEIIPSTQAKQSNGRPIVSSRPSEQRREALNNKPIVYEPDALKRMQHNLQHDQRLRLLPFGTLDKIRIFIFIDLYSRQTKVDSLWALHLIFLLQTHHWFPHSLGK